MIRLWLGVALLSGSWLFGLPYVEPANPLVWLMLVLAGTVCLSGSAGLTGSRPQIAWAIVCLLPAVWLLPWPYRMAPLLLVTGLMVQLLPLPVRWPQAAGRGALWAGGILVGQAVLLELYQYQTARSHELPGTVVWLLAALMRLAGVDAAANTATANGCAIVIRSMGGRQAVAATWELVFDPATFAFLIGGLIFLGLWTCAHSRPGSTWRTWLTAARWLLLAIALWLPLRVVLVLGLYLHRVLIEQTEMASVAANQFVSAWVYLLLLAGPVFFAACLAKRRTDAGGFGDQNDADPATVPSADARQSSRWRPVVVTLVLLAASVAVFTFGHYWTPVGKRQAGRVMIVERHSTWEPTTRPYDTEWYGEIASYNYAAAYEYLSQYYEMSRLLEDDRIDEQALSSCDVLVIKIPTARFEPAEVTAIVEFVKRGGGLLLVGDHTNVFNCSTYLNDISRPFGFTFRNDLLFRVGAPYKQHYERPLVPHPAVQHVPKMDFAVSCSIDPGRSGGEMVMRNTGLWNLPPDYNASNYHPQAEYRPDMQIGAFCQIWSTTAGNGRVLAFTDSTLFSNFCTFQEGKAEMLRSMVEYLNRRSPLDLAWLRRTVSASLLALSLALLIAAVWYGRGQSILWGLLLGAGMLGWSLATVAVIAVHSAALPPPPMQRPLTHVVVDRTLSEVPLSLGAFPQGDGEGYGLLEQWIPRLANYTSREKGPAVFSGDALVVVEPTRSVPDWYVDALLEYVRSGGNVLLMDSPDNGLTSINSLLWPLGMELSHAASQAGRLRLFDKWPDVELQAASAITGGEPIAWIGDLPVAAQVRLGQGTVTVAGFAYLFSDAGLGGHWMPQPDEETRARYNILFALLEAAIKGQRPDAKWAQSPKDSPDLPADVSSLPP